MILYNFPNLYHSFHTSVSRSKEHRYSINGSEMSREQILRLDPAERSVAHWAVLIDWDLQRTRPYVVVDPMDPTGLLYLNSAEYLSQMKVCASVSLMLIVVARPGTIRPVPISSGDSSDTKTSPPQNPSGVHIEDRWTRASRISWAAFLSLRKKIHNLSNRKENSKMVSESVDTIAQTVHTWVYQLAHWAEVDNPGSYSRYFIPLVYHLKKLLRNNGQMAVVQHLKVSLFVLYSYISGNPLMSTIQLGHGIRLTNGLPTVWDRQLRTFVREGRLSQIRIIASLLNLYRALEAPHPDFSVETIVRPHPKLEGEIWEEFKIFCQAEWPDLLEAHIKAPLPEFKYQSGLFHIVWSAGANVSGPAMAGITRDARAWTLQPKNHISDWFALHEDVRANNAFNQAAIEAHFPTESETKPSQEDILLSVTPKIDPETGQMLGYMKVLPEPLGSQATFSRYFWGTRDAFSNLKGLSEIEIANLEAKLGRDPIENVHNPILGRLHAIPEPAGKVRVVAICDYWTQVAMKPVHDFLFSLLARIKTDATFDQLGRVEEYFQMGYKPHWSFDLKAATDLIPLDLYLEVLTPLFKSKERDYESARRITELWAKILTDRDWLTPDKKNFVRYGTGQPMGALSSWASMALVHHALVQFAAKRAGHTTWFTTYRVLGDDIDIAREASVATGYQEICAAFSIIIGLLKSLHSEDNVFEFANQRYCPGGNISPVSYKEEIQAQTFSARLEFARRILARFGTSLKDQGAALFRKAATCTQWRLLAIENSVKGREQVLTDLFRFCLENPFVFNESPPIDTLLLWVNRILPKKDRIGRPDRMSSDLINRFKATYTRLLLEHLREKVVHSLSSLPTPFEVVITPIGDNDPISESILKWSTGNILLPVRGQDASTNLKRAEAARRELYTRLDSKSPNAVWSYPKVNAKFSIYYLIECLNRHNEVTADKLKKLHNKLDIAIMGLDQEQAIYLSCVARGKKYFDPYDTAHGLYREWQNISPSVTIELRKPMSDYLSFKEEETPATGVFSKVSLFKVSYKQENLTAPVYPLLLSLTRVLGRVVPGLPYILKGFNRRKGKWMVDYSEAIYAYCMEALLSDALHRYSRRALADVWRPTGGRIEII